MCLSSSPYEGFSTGFSMWSLWWVKATERSQPSLYPARLSLQPATRPSILLGRFQTILIPKHFTTRTFLLVCDLGIFCAIKLNIFHSHNALFVIPVTLWMSCKSWCFLSCKSSCSISASRWIFHKTLKHSVWHWHSGKMMPVSLNIKEHDSNFLC